MRTHARSARRFLGTFTLIIFGVGRRRPGRARQQDPRRLPVDQPRLGTGRDQGRRYVAGGRVRWRISTRPSRWPGALAADSPGVKVDSLLGSLRWPAPSPPSAVVYFNVLRKPSTKFEGGVRMLTTAGIWATYPQKGLSQQLSRRPDRPDCRDRDAGAGRCSRWATSETPALPNVGPIVVALPWAAIGMTFG